jgi:site-specific recombinase XerD
MTTYGTGLRISEACALQTTDIDSKRMLIHVREGKRARDRYVPLPDKLLTFLRQYWLQQKPSAVYLFSASNDGRPIAPKVVRSVLQKAIRKAGITKRVTPHVLRHTFATHLLEVGTDIRVIQAVLGHASIRTTTRYTQVSRKHIGRVRSPLDLLGKEQGRTLG